MRRAPLKIGDHVEVPAIVGAQGTITGEVITFRLCETRQIITVKTAYGTETLVIDLSINMDSPRVIVPPVHSRDARMMALELLSGSEHRMPVSLLANYLAATVVNLTGGAA